MPTQDTPKDSASAVQTKIEGEISKPERIHSYDPAPPAASPDAEEPTRSKDRVRSYSPANPGKPSR